MKVLVTGAKGQLGYDCVNELVKQKHEAIGVDIEEMDITDSSSVQRVIREVNPDAVIHCAAWTAVDAAEDEGNRRTVHLINATGTNSIASVCKELNCKMMYISTDYVFNGQGTEPWQADCKDYQPLNVFDVSVDLRSNSDTYGKWFGLELTEENKKQFYFPEGFAYGFLVLSDVSKFCYKCTDFYHPNDEGALPGMIRKSGFSGPS